MLPGLEIAKQVIPGNKFVIIEGGTVIMNREIPEKVAAAILPFLESLRG